LDELDAWICIVFDLPGGQRDNPKRYRFTPSVSNWRMPDALSVDALCGFGAKNLNRCAEFLQLALQAAADPWLS
jgi:hypothetical protein